jgi:hypothetical protein
MEQRTKPEAPKPYEAPELVMYGRMSDLTHAKGGGGGSGHGGSRS